MSFENALQGGEFGVKVADLAQKHVLRKKGGSHQFETPRFRDLYEKLNWENVGLRRAKDGRLYYSMKMENAPTKKWDDLDAFHTIEFMGDKGRVRRIRFPVKMPDQKA